MNKKVVIIVVVVALLCCLVTCALLLLAPSLIPKDLLDKLGVNSSFTSTITTGDYEQVNVSRNPGSDEERYTHSDLGFSMIVPSAWEVDETDTAVEFTADDNNGSINFEAFEDSAFGLITSIDQEFCDSFGEGFRSGLGLEETDTESFQFKVFSLNGNVGCRSEGSIFEGITQRYYVFFNDSNKKVYSIFYTATSEEEAEELAGLMDTFDIN